MCLEFFRGEVVRLNSYFQQKLLSGNQVRATVSVLASSLGAVKGAFHLASIGLRLASAKEVNHEALINGIRQRFLCSHAVSK